MIQPKLGGRAVRHLGFTVANDLVIVQETERYGTLQIRGWNWRRGELLWQTMLPECVLFSPDHALLARFQLYGPVSGGELSVFATTTLEEVGRLSLPHRLNDCCFSPDAARIIATFFNGDVLVWNVRSAIIEHQFSLRGARSVAISPSGESFALVEWPDRIQFWQRSTPEDRQVRIPVPAQSIRRIALIDDLTIAVLFNGVVIFDLKQGKKLARLRGTQKHTTDLSVSPYGRLVATSSNDGVIRFWDTASWNSKSAYDWKIGKIAAVAFSHDGLTCAAGGTRGRVVIWDVEEA